MRPSKLKWQKTADACTSLFNALETIAGALQTSDPRTTDEVVGALADARKKVADLKEHVEESEECEED
jgi:sensor histidine kinase YesM